MNDETSTNDDEADKGPVGGERLRAARRANDISVSDVAKELHLDELKVRALERNEFEVLGAPVFAKGHLRKYAELVGVAVDDIMTDYYQMTRSSGVPPVVGPKRVKPRDINPAPWIGGAIAVMLVAGGAYWWFALRSTEPVATIEPATLAPFVVEQETGEPVADEPELLPEQNNESVDPPVAAEAVVLPAETESEPVEDEPDYQPTPGVTQVSVDLAFTGDCWTEVSDASGRRLFYDLGTEGRVVTLSGDAPLRVILGDSENVSVTVDGRPWPIPASARSGRLARLNIRPQ
jgi:cytoskeleton protein RodZ